MEIGTQVRACVPISLSIGLADPHDHKCQQFVAFIRCYVSALCALYLIGVEPRRRQSAATEAEECPEGALE